MGEYLSKRSLIKRTRSWHHTLFVLWTLNRQAKIFLCTAYWIMKIGGKHHTGDWGKNISKKNITRSNLMGRNFFVKRKMFSWKYKISIKFTTLLIAWSICFLDCYKDKNTKLHSFLCSHRSTSPTSNTSFQLGQTWSYLKYVLNISY